MRKGEISWHGTIGKGSGPPQALETCESRTPRENKRHQIPNNKQAHFNFSEDACSSVKARDHLAGQGPQLTVFKRLWHEVQRNTQWFIVLVFFPVERWPRSRCCRRKTSLEYRPLLQALHFRGIFNSPSSSRRRQACWP